MSEQLLQLIERREAELAEEVRMRERALRKTIDVEVLDDGRLCGYALAKIGNLTSLQMQDVIESAHQLARAQAAYISVKQLLDDALRVVRRSP